MLKGARNSSGADLDSIKLGRGAQPDEGRAYFLYFIGLLRQQPSCLVGH